MNVSVTVVDTDHPQEWLNTLDEIGVYSLYHLPAFHRIAERNGDGTAIMPVFKLGPHVMAFPMLIRPMTTNTGPHCDATSVRGFAGPLVSQPPPPEDTKQAFRSALLDFLEQRDIISVFVRLHPLVCDYSLLSGYGLLTEVGVTLSMDLTLPSDAQWANYRSDHRKVTRRLQRKGFYCEEAGVECLDEIVTAYHQTMRRVGADEAFLFDRSYFAYLLGEMSDVIRLFVCKMEDSIAGFHICAICGGIIESYLSGTSDDFVQHSPSRLLYEALRLWGNRTGAKAIHLGGGVGAQRDLLYDFKSGFATSEHTYSTWRCIVNPAAYAAACKRATRGAEEDVDVSYFPAYRAPALSHKQPHISNTAGAIPTETHRLATER